MIFFVFFVKLQFYEKKFPPENSSPPPPPQSFFFVCFLNLCSPSNINYKILFFFANDKLRRSDKRKKLIVYCKQKKKISYYYFLIHTDKNNTYASLYNTFMGKICCENKCVRSESKSCLSSLH